MLWFYERFNFNESYFTIHPFFTLKIADAIILYAREVLKIFNRHLNHKREFTVIAERLYAIIFDILYGSLILSSPLFTLAIVHYSCVMHKIYSCVQFMKVE